MEFALFPKQIQLKNLLEKSTKKWVGYGGARGGGKSHGIVELAIYLGIKYNIHILIFRRISDQLVTTHVDPLKKNHPELIKFYNDKYKTLRNPNTGNPMIKFGYAESESDIYKFQGQSYDIIFIDEATQSTQTQIEFLSSCLRKTTIAYKNLHMVLTMNPGGVGHAYIKRIFIDKEYMENENPEDYTFIQSCVWDNAWWVINYLQENNLSIVDYFRFNEEERINLTLTHSEYAKTLAALPEDKKRAYLYGDWNVYSGMFFKGFDKERQIIKPFKIPKEWSLIASIDPGRGSVCVCSLGAMDFEGNVYIIGSYYYKGKTPLENAKGIKDFIVGEYSPIHEYLSKKPDMWVAGHDAWAQKDRYAVVSSDVTFADIFIQNDMPLMKCNRDRVQGWWAWKNLIPNKFFMFEGFNKEGLSEMMSVESDENQPEDIAGLGRNIEVKDDFLDATRYLIMALMKPQSIEVPIKEVSKRVVFSREYSEMTYTIF